jgi:SAM-dependent methyltransferase
MNLNKRKLLYPLRIVRQLVFLPRYTRSFEARDEQLATQISSLQDALTRQSDSLNSLREAVSILPSLDARVVNIQHKLNHEQLVQSSSQTALNPVNNTVSDNHEFDYFYKLFEDKFRGTEDIIKERVVEHIPHFLGLPAKLKKLPIVDIGCGRGEFLSVLKDNKLHGIGVDMNASMVERANKLGYEAEENDALNYLKKQDTSSLAAITGFHIVEHIPFEALLRIFEEAYRTVAKGGFVLFETPNPQALSVGANTFYLDPSHQRPIPSQLLAFMLESVGFKPEIMHLHRVRPEIKHNDPVTVDLYDALYGPGDYAVIARKII